MNYSKVISNAMIAAFLVPSLLGLIAMSAVFGNSLRTIGFKPQV